MAEILPPRIESISDPGSGPRDQPEQHPRAKGAVVEKPLPPELPEISPPEEEEKHDLDEMA